MPWSRTTFVGISLVGVGGLLLTLVGSYVLYATQATSSLEELVVDQPESLEHLRTPAAILPFEGKEVSAPPATTPPVVEKHPVHASPLPDLEMEPSADGERPEDPLQAYSPSYVVAPEPGTTYPLTPLTSISSGETLPAGGTGLRDLDLRAFQSVDWTTLPETSEVLPPATRIQIPVIGLDSSIVELGTTWVGESLVWESPKYQVGHHQGTVNPGEVGNTVLSGHISTPLRREGAIFKHLPRIPTLLKEGRMVDLILSTREGRYLYRVVSTDYATPEEVVLFRPTEEPSLTLIPCVPDLVYSHRLLVNAILVGKAPLQ